MFSFNSRQSDRDVRMRGFTERTRVAAAVAWIDGSIPTPASESIPLDDAAGRRLASSITSAVDVPGFARSMMDGFALRAADLEKASSDEPVTLRIVGDAFPGVPYVGPLKSGEAVRIMTGAPMAQDADAVVPVEQVQMQGNSISIEASTPVGKHVGLPGEDVTAGMMVLAAGRCLRPQDVGLLASIGLNRVDVLCRPIVHLITTGNELLAMGNQPREFHVTDSNTPMLEALIRRDGGCVTQAGIVPDDPEKILTALQADAQIVIVSGGSSVGLEDHVPQLIAEHGELAIHGIAMRPSSPTGIGKLGTKLVFLLPGNPVSCLCGYDFFAGRAIRQLAGRTADWPYPSHRLPLREALTSSAGRVDYVRVKIVNGQVEKVVPQGGSALYSSVCADGFVVIAEDEETLPADTPVTVYLYDCVR